MWFHCMGQVLQTKKIASVSYLSRKGINASTLPKAESGGIIYALEGSHFVNLLYGLPVYFAVLPCVVTAFYFSVQLSFSQSNSFVGIGQLLSDFCFSADVFYLIRIRF